MGGILDGCGGGMFRPLGFKNPKGVFKSPEKQSIKTLFLLIFCL
jgi:hypothetical protein